MTSPASAPKPSDQALALLRSALGHADEGDVAPPTDAANVNYGAVLRRIRDAQVASVYATLALLEEVGRLRVAVGEVAEAVREVDLAGGSSAQERGTTPPAGRQTRGGGVT